MPLTASQVTDATRTWVEHGVIGLNLCPYAKGVQARGLVRYVVSPATVPQALLDDLRQEMVTLAQSDPARLDTTLLIHPHVLQDFLDFNDFLDEADLALKQLGLDGILQVASFHPHYQFAGTDPDDLTNATNRAPFPTLHLLREASVERAVATLPAPQSIYEANLLTLETLGADGWAQLQALWDTPAPRG